MTNYARLQEEYHSKHKSVLKDELQLSSIMQVPELKKIVVNVGAGEAVQNPKVMNGIIKNLATITGQQPVRTRARKSIATFKLREGMVLK